MWSESSLDEPYEKVKKRSSHSRYERVYLNKPFWHRARVLTCEASHYYSSQLLNYQKCIEHIARHLVKISSSALMHIIITWHNHKIIMILAPLSSHRRFPSSGSAEAGGSNSLQSSPIRSLPHWNSQSSMPSTPDLRTRTPHYVHSTRSVIIPPSVQWLCKTVCPPGTHNLILKEMMQVVPELRVSRYHI